MGVGPDPADAMVTQGERWEISGPQRRGHSDTIAIIIVRLPGLDGMAWN